ncbi:hypothetical protein C0Q70_03442 [Pomacea canaliculata]|uniref:RING-type domain-containing protein n=1 Tax=Pomacea canaliculata TaxID=400727 RepID=A0A2T7PSQ6_POMCA|nr:hypothetical protein C0Q70_03442 [Pomacea canaliculata]
MAATHDSVTCAVCMEVYRSPRFLPCYHTFCLPCLEELANKHGKIIPCPTCRTPATVPPGGVCDLQVNFYFTDEALEQARSEGSQSMCPVHTKKRLVLYCTECHQAICTRCKLTKHEGHVTEDLADAVVRCKQTIEDRLQSFMDNISRGKDKLESCKQNEKRALEKRAAVTEQAISHSGGYQTSHNPLQPLGHNRRESYRWKIYQSVAFGFFGTGIIVADMRHKQRESMERWESLVKTP